MVDDAGDLTRFLPRSCDHCGAAYGVEHIERVEYKGMRQVVPGKDAVPVTDVTFRCPGCDIYNLVRYHCA